MSVRIELEAHLSNPDESRLLKGVNYVACKRAVARLSSRDMAGRNQEQALSKDIRSNLQETGAVAHQELFGQFSG
jgi:hypothetical protein